MSKHHDHEHPNYSNLTTIGERDLVGYLKSILSRYAGYPFISICKVSAPDTPKTMGIIQVHQMLPNMDKHKIYRSTKDQKVVIVELNDPEFPGMVMDRQGHATFGDPFHVELDHPELELLLDEVFKPKQVILDLSQPSNQDQRSTTRDV